MAADDDQGRERLVRCCIRPAFALDRIELLPDGGIAHLMKTPRRGRTHRVMSPMEFMARPAALFPTPKLPLVRYHGVIAPCSSWRSLVTPKPPAAVVEARLRPEHAAPALRRGKRGSDGPKTARQAPSPRGLTPTR
ncbi:transposase [Sorangium sp. So ce1504]|uniref:transposase n=1 Tax=Sorangium sp. So ce1504 TaxID=3133337 RepID=UPI003F5F52DF